MSIPGQTMGMAVFSDQFIENLGLSRTQLSTAYLIGTVASSLWLTQAGRWFDRFGARVVLTGASLLLAIALCFIAVIDRIGRYGSEWLAMPLAWLTFPLILLGYFGVRFSGQGVLTSASRNLLLLWFVRRRGLISGVRGVFVSLGFSLAPLVLGWLIDAVTWRDALFVMALALFGFSLVCVITVRDRPQVCGLHPDNELAANDATEQALDSVADSNSANLTLPQARSQSAFWMYASALAIHALFGTALTFHVVAIFAQAGRSKEEAFGYFIPQAIVSVTVNLFASALADYVRLKPLLIVMLSAFCLGALGLLSLDTPSGYGLLVVGFGAGGGLWGVLSNLAFVRQFGSLHLGEISGFNTSITVFASAVGPVLFSLANDLTGRFVSAAIGCLVVLVILLILAITLSQPRDVKPNQGGARQ